MYPNNHSRFPATFGKTVVLFIAAIGLAACNSSGSNTVENTLDVAPQNGQQVARSAPIDAIQDPRGYCPKTVIRAGTETYNVYPKGVSKDDEGSSAQLRYRATIGETVRECNTASGQLLIRVGVKGRYLSGPKGETGSFLMPVRIAMTQGDAVLYSKLHKIPADIPPGRTNGTFAYVDNDIAIPIPDKENLVIYVGYDEGPYDTP